MWWFNYCLAVAVIVVLVVILILKDVQLYRARVNERAARTDAKQTRRGFAYLSDAHESLKEHLALARWERDAAQRLLGIIVTTPDVAQVLQTPLSKDEVLHTFRKPVA